MFSRVFQYSLMYGLSTLLLRFSFIIAMVSLSLGTPTHLKADLGL